jgi:CheY-like chemotaxis protein
MALMLHVDCYPRTAWRSCENGAAPSADASDDDRSGASPHRRHTTRPRSVPENKGCVLLVDDDKAVRETLAELLDDVGFHAVVAADAIEALLILRQPELIDVLVTDLTMPGDDGIALIRQARVIRSDLPAILLTGYAEQVTSVTTIAGGNFHVLRKPVESDRLIQELELLLAKTAI